MDDASLGKTRGARKGSTTRIGGARKEIQEEADMTEGHHNL
jgi:hypothetical protein